MPSIRSLIPFVGLALTALLQVTSAIPTPVISTAAGVDDCPDFPSGVATPTVPVDGASGDLPTTNLTLVAVAIGRGIQNYTCAAANSTGVAIGAIATLYDATPVAMADEATLNTLPALAVFEALPAAGAPLTVSGHTFPRIGNHFFDIAGTPTFELTALNKVLFGLKADSVTAPTGSSEGPDGTAAVAWLYLTAHTGYTSVGLTEAYRVETAGGSATACTEAGVISVQYSAQYWFYN